MLKEQLEMISNQIEIACLCKKHDIKLHAKYPSGDLFIRVLGCPTLVEDVFVYASFGDTDTRVNFSGSWMKLKKFLEIAI